MIAPNQDQIVAGITAIENDPDAQIYALQLEELKSAAPDVAASEDGREGYKLGLAVARAVIASSAEVLMHGADPKKIL